jgi:hypothetical protein
MTQVDLTDTLSRMMSPVRGDVVNTDAGPGGRAPQSSRPGPAVEPIDPASDSFDEFGEEIDDAFLAQVEIVENAALGLPPPPAASQHPRPVGGRERETQDIINIDEDEDDKENMPVPTRRVRRRTLSPEIIDLSD